jgi:Protein of unknown function (DUF551)
VTEWQPIETLPDRKVVLLWQPADKKKFQPEGMVVGSIEREGWEHRKPPFYVHPANIGGWEWESDIDAPTHWMELPQPPQTEPKP